MTDSGDQEVLEELRKLGIDVEKVSGKPHGQKYRINQENYRLYFYEGEVSPQNQGKIYLYGKNEKLVAAFDKDGSDGESSSSKDSCAASTLSGRADKELSGGEHAKTVPVCPACGNRGAVEHPEVNPDAVTCTNDKCGVYWYDIAEGESSSNSQVDRVEDTQGESSQSWRNQKVEIWSQSDYEEFWSQFVEKEVKYICGICDMPIRKSQMVSHMEKNHDQKYEQHNRRLESDEP